MTFAGERSPDRKSSACGRTSPPELRYIGIDQVGRLSPALEIVAAELASLRFQAASAKPFAPPGAAALACLRPLIVSQRRSQKSALAEYQLLGGLRTLRMLQAIDFAEEVPALILHGAAPSLEVELAVMDAIGCTILDLPTRGVLRPLGRMVDVAMRDPVLGPAFKSMLPGVTGPRELARLLQVKEGDLWRAIHSATSEGQEDLASLLQAVDREPSDRGEQQDDGSQEADDPHDGASGDPA